jgi:acetolactate synthase-1/2/3 large subunit
MMTTFATETVRILEEVGCTKAFGVSGGYVFPLWHALASCSIDVYHCRSENGATFSAMEHSLHTNTIAAVFATSGPGLTNAFTALRSARADGAKLVLLSAITTENEQDPKKVQESSPGNVQLFTGDSVQLPFSQSLVIRHRADLAKLWQVLYHLQSSCLGTLGVFIAPEIQKSFIAPLVGLEALNGVSPIPGEPKMHHWIHFVQTKLQKGKHVIWAGYGAMKSANNLLELAENYDTPVMTTPRAKGVFPETHPLSWGCTGLGGNVEGSLSRAGSNWGVIVLGTRLEELSSSFIQFAWKERDIIAVTITPEGIRRNLPPHAIVIDADVTELLCGLVNAITTPKMSTYRLERYMIPPEKATPNGLHPVSVLSAVQEIAVRKHDYTVIADIGNTLAWVTRYLKFNTPGYFRISTHEAAMTHAACGVVGIGSNNTPVIAIVGDGAMIMQNELSTAVRYQMPIIWLVMNDSRYNMCQQVFNIEGAEIPDCSIPPIQFAKYGEAIGAKGLTVGPSQDIDEALSRAIAWKTPTVIDVKIDGNIPAPIGSRVKSLSSR